VSASSREPELRFEPIDLSSAADIAIRFQADAFQCSFNSTEGFYEADGKGHERYLVWLAERMRSLPGSCVHVWSRDSIIGQLQMGRFRPDPQLGYVNLYYLAPSYRDRGLGGQLDGYATEYLKGQGFGAARLSVSPNNAQALTFYLKNGWQNLGPRPDHPEVHLMGKDLR